MKNFALSGFSEGGTYDVDNPTRQTEELASELRTCLYNLQEDDYLLSSIVESADVSSVQGVIQGVSSLLSQGVNPQGIAGAIFEQDVGSLPSPGTPASVLTAILPVLPDLISGAINPLSLLPALLPIFLKQSLSGLVPSVVSGGQVVPDMDGVVKAIDRQTQTVIEQYNSLCDAIHALEEYKQVAIMRTAEVDKVIFSEPL